MGDCTLFECKCGVKRKLLNTSYANVISHVRPCHPNYEKMLRTDEVDAIDRVEQYFENGKSNVFYGWFRPIVMMLLPFSYVKNDILRASVRNKHISLSTPTTYLPRLTQSVESKISDLLSDNFALIFDGCSYGTTHFLVDFASFPATTKKGYSMRVLAFLRYWRKINYMP